VSERSDGIKSFFHKQQASPAKGVDHSASPRTPVKETEKPTKAEIKEEAEGIDTEVTAHDGEKGLGDDSNAPDPEATEEEKPSIEAEAGSKRKRGRPAEVVADEEEQEKKQEKRGGHQTKVIRRTPSDDTNKAVGSLGGCGDLSLREI